MAEYVSRGFDKARENERQFGERKNEVRYSRREIERVETTDVIPATEKESLELDILDARNLSRYYRDVTDALNNRIKSNRLILIGKPPAILQKYMGSNNPLYIPQSMVYKVAFERSDDGKHGLGRVVIDDLPYQFTKPLAITGNTTRHQSFGDKSIVVWTDWKTESGDAIIVPIRIDVNGRVGTYNNVNSVFDAYDQDYIDDLLRDGNILYTENNRDIHELLNNQGREVPKSQATNVSMDRIAHEDKKVNTLGENHSDIADLKAKQFEIIQENNPAYADLLTWIRKQDDIHTFEEALADSIEHGEYDEGENFDPYYTWDMAQKALKSGKITVYSSHPIEQGAFVTPSKMEATDYAGNGRIYQKTVSLTDVAWIDPTQGQYANVNEAGSGKYNDPNARKSKDDTIHGDNFKEWFGDWQNDPQNASKVVDKDGKPLVVYHQTGADFTVFDTESKGAARDGGVCEHGI